MTIYYDNKFNQNEWFVLTLLLCYIIVFLLPKRFPLLTSLLFLLFGISIAIFMDHSISINPIDFYDVNDSSKFELYDFLLYFAYGPFSYLMVYFFDKFKLKKRQILLYIPLCSFAAMGFEWLAKQFGVFHYKNGYQILYSLPIYLVVFSILFYFYFKLYRDKLSQ